jgi:pSer/pThr/pTyr-binding forkhead associated (FHA) protein
MAPGRLLLEVVAGNAAGSHFEVEDDFLIGRQADGEGTLADDDEISRRHARISRSPEGGFVIEDLGSTNGTFVNGEQIAAPRRLAEGDRVEVGGTTLVVHAEAAPAGQTAARAIPGQAPATPPLNLRIDIDLAGRAATVALDDDSDAVRLEYAEGAWRFTS